MRKRVFVNPVIGDKATLLKSSEETNGACTLLEVEVVPGGGNTLHTHEAFSETFRVLEGELTVSDGKHERVLCANECYTVKPFELHCFKNVTSKPVRFHVELKPGHEGFEKVIAIGYGLAADGLVDARTIPKNFSHLAILVVASGTIPTGVFRFIMPLLRWVASRAKTVERQLIKKYCYMGLSQFF